MSDKSSSDTWSDKIDMRITQYRYFKEHNERILEAEALMEQALKQGHKILVFGNGGSATQAAHFAAELVNKFYFKRKALPAIALTTDTACITSIANDMDYKYVFSRQVEALGTPGDVAVGLTTSGKSPNVLEALRQAREMGLKTIALCGQYTADMETTGIDVITPVLCGDTPTIQELHLFILHAWAEALELHFRGGDR